MNGKMMRTAGLALALALAGGVVAQPTPPNPPAQSMPHDRHGMGKGRMHGPHDRMGMHGFHGGWQKLSPAGRDIMRVAMRGPDDREQRRAAYRALDERAATLLAADRLDVAGMRQTMAEKAAMRAADEQRRQQALLDAYQRLSLADRKALAEAMQPRRDRATTK